MDHGKIICVAMPHKFKVERRYMHTFLKMLFYTHALRRFDKPARSRRDDNLLILWAAKRPASSPSTCATASSSALPTRKAQSKAPTSLERSASSKSHGATPAARCPATTPSRRNTNLNPTSSAPCPNTHTARSTANAVTTAKSFYPSSPMALYASGGAGEIR